MYHSPVVTYLFYEGTIVPIMVSRFYEMLVKL
jgi:hypothetical protein